MNFIERFLEWCKINYINVSHKKDLIYHVDGLRGVVVDDVLDNDGDILLLEPHESGKIFDDEFGLNGAEEQFQPFDKGIVQFLCFEFGQRFYYISRNGKNIFKNKFNEIKYRVDFNDFKYLGNHNCSLDVPFVHLGVHSEYELLNGSHNPSVWIKKANFLKHEAIGISDRNTLAGVLSFQTECHKKEIKSILGMTVGVAINYDSDSQIPPVIYDMKLYVMNEIGWQNILSISKAINVDYKNFIPESVLLELGKGLIAVFASNSQLFELSDIRSGKILIKKYSSKFEHLFCQIDSVEFYDNKIDIEHLNKIKLYVDNYIDDVEPVLINDSYYVDQEMFQLKELLNKVGRMALPYSVDQYFKTLDDVNNKLSPLFKKKQELYYDLLSKMINNTNKISELCNFKINTGQYKLPKYEFVTNGQSNEEFFKDLLIEGFQRKIDPNREDYEVYVERLMKEMKVIIEAGFVDYFLILWEMVSWAKKEGIFIGPGRGSIGGAILAFLLDITEIDPIKHNLLFERFINEARIMPEKSYKIELENGEIIELKSGSKIKLVNGKYINVEELQENDDVDIRLN